MAQEHVSSFRTRTAAMSTRFGVLRTVLRRSRFVATALVIAAAVLGAIVGAAIGAASPTSQTVTAEVYAQPTPTLENADPSPTTQDSNDIFMQSQIEYLSGLRESLPGNAVVTVSQVGLSSVLQISATADSAGDAVGAANTVLDRYITLRKQQVNDYADNATTKIQAQIDSDDSQLNAASSGNGAAAKAASLRADYAALFTQLRQVQLAAQTASPASTIHRARFIDVTASSDAARDAILGLIVGAIVAVAALVVLRRDQTTPVPVTTSTEPPSHNGAAPVNGSAGSTTGTVIGAAGRRRAKRTVVAGGPR